MAARKKPAKKLGKKALKQTKGGFNFGAPAVKVEGIKITPVLGGGLNLYKP